MGTAPLAAVDVHSRKTGERLRALNYALALSGLFGLLWGGWTIVAWLLDGPKAITIYRTPGSASWWAAHTVEVVVWLLAIPIAMHIWQQCKQEGRLSFDAKLCVAFLLVYWQDPLCNFFEPVALYNSNFVNFGTWCGHMPIAPNQLCERIVQPVLMGVPLYLFDFLLLVILINAFMRWVSRRKPRLSKFQMMSVALLGAAIVNLLFMAPTVPLNLWTFPHLPWSLWSRDVRYPLSDLLAFTLFFFESACLRYFRDSEGRTLVEQGLDELRPSLRNTISMLALIGFVQIGYAFSSSLDIMAAPFGDYFAPVPREVINGVCDDGKWDACPLELRNR